MTRCSRASSRWHWSAPAASAAAAATIVGSGVLAAKVEAGLGFALTGAQRMAIAEISAEMAQPRRMMRLLQGDVGSGKTVVALMAMLAAVESGAQAALMAPTEILARQHQATLRRLAGPAGVEIGIADRPREGPGARRDPGRPRLRRHDRRRHPRAVAGGRRVSRPRARRRSTSSTALASSSAWRSPKRAATPTPW